MAVATPPFPSPAGFDLLGEIGRGGMGVVFRARDTAFHRDVAVKVLLSDPDSPAAKRFADEARITAQLQHPGIPAVHQTGTLPDGRPYLVMKLIQGRTLAALLKERGHGSAKWLGVFEGICQAVGSAHANGVTHRDLKPANVMVGAFGEVQVMDWGLAKHVANVGRDGQAESVSERSGPSTVIHPTGLPATIAVTLPPAADGQSVTRSQAPVADTDRGGGSGTPQGTRLGTILGTPAYMSPEQARGEVDRLDCRTDVFALGAMLCELLTGTPPLTGKVPDVLTAAAAGRFADALARLDGCGEDPALVALAKRCLGTNPQDRPADASAVAAAVALFRGETEARAKRAEVEKAEATVQAAEQRKRRRVQGWLGGVAVAFLLAGVAGTGVGLVQAERRRGEADEARGREKERADAAETAEAAERRAKEDVARGKEELQKTNDALVKANAAEQAARALAQDAEDAAVQILVEGTNDAVRNLIGSKSALGPQETAYLEGMVKRWRTFADRTGDDDRSRLVRASAHQQLGLLWGKLGLPDRAEADFRAACDLLEKLTADQPDRRGMLLVCLHQLSLAERAQFKLKEAEKRLRRVLDLLRLDGPWAGRVPDRLDKSASAHIDLGAVLDEGDKRKEAEKEYRTGLKECDQLLAAKPDDRAVQVTRGTGLTNLGLLLGDTDRPDEAEGLFREAVRQYAALAKAEPGSTHYRADLAGVHTHLGQLLRVKREFGESEAELRAGLAILVKLAADSPAVPTFRAALAVTHGHLGLLLADRKKVEAAAKEYKAGIAIQEKLIAEQPKATGYQVELAGGCCNLGELLRANGQPADSLEWFDKAVKALTPLVQNANEDPLARPFLFISHWRRAHARAQTGKHADAVTDWDRVLALVDPSGRLPFRVERMASLAAAGKVSEAVAEADAVLKRAGWSGDQFVQFAAVYAVASGSVEGKADEYALKAVELLTKATKSGFKDVARLKADKQLDPLRDRDDFKALLADLEKRFPRPLAPPPRPR